MKRLLFLSCILLPHSLLLAQTPNYFGTTGASGTPISPEPHVAMNTAQKPLEGQIRAVYEKFEAAMSRINAEEMSHLGPAKTEFLKELAKLRELARNQGNLTEITDIDAAIKDIQDGTTPPPSKAVSPALQRAHSSYEFNIAPTLKQYGEQRARLSADFAKAMDDLEQNFTRAGNLESAQQARSARINAPLGFTVDLIAAMDGVKVERGGFTLVKNEIATATKFHPPLEIEYTFMTESQVRLGYAAEQIIFNWEVNRDELRVDGGPVGGQHRGSAGRIPTKQIVQIRQVVLPDKMTIFVDGRERATWKGDFSGVNETISLRSLNGTTSVKQITAKKL